MPRKRKRLPDNISEIMRRGDFEELKSLYDSCEITAYTTAGKLPFFLYTPCSEFYKWLVEQGLDINARNRMGNTPLHEQAQCYYNNVEGLILAGADVDVRTDDSYEKTALLIAAGVPQPSSAKILIKYGADVNAIDKGGIHTGGMTPLERLFFQCKPNNLLIIEEIAEALISAGANISDKAKEGFIQLGKDYERARDNIIYTDDIQPYDKAIERLYKLFDLKPVKSVHNGTDLITVSSSDWRNQHEELWNYLVPYSGKCKTVQGEAVRICGRVYDEVVNNGGVNWDSDYEKMLSALKKYYTLGNMLNKKERREAYSLIEQIDEWVSADIILRVCEINVHWVLNNPKPIPLGDVAYTR